MITFYQCCFCGKLHEHYRKEQCEHCNSPLRKVILDGSRLREVEDDDYATRHEENGLYGNEAEFNEEVQK